MRGVLPPAPATKYSRIFLDFDGGLLADRSGVVAVPGSTGIVHPGFVPFGTSDREGQIQNVVQAVRNDFAPYPVQVLRDDQWQLNPRFATGDTVILVGGDGSWLVGPNPTSGGGQLHLTAGYAPWNPGNTTTDVGFAFSAAGAQALALLAGSASGYVQQLANTISHEAGHTFGLDHGSSTSAPTELMAAVDAPVTGDALFTTQVLPREHGASYSSDAYLRSLFGLSSAPLPDQGTGGFLPQSARDRIERPRPLATGNRRPDRQRPDPRGSGSRQRFDDPPVG